MNQPNDAQTAVATATRVWPQLSALLTPPRTSEEFERLVKFSHDLIDSGAGDENNPLASLLDLVGISITTYEREHGLLWKQQSKRKRGSASEHESFSNAVFSWKKLYAY
jgi:hypothetical protein